MTEEATWRKRRNGEIGKITVKTAKQWRKYKRRKQWRLRRNYIWRTQKLSSSGDVREITPRRRRRAPSKVVHMYKRMKPETLLHITINHRINSENQIRRCDVTATYRKACDTGELCPIACDESARRDDEQKKAAIEECVLLSRRQIMLSKQHELRTVI